MTFPACIIGMIGIGQLGLPIARNLLESGYQVVGYRRVDREAFVALGAEALDSPAAVAARADVLLLCLPSEEAQLDVLHGDRGVLGALRPGQVIIDLGTYRKEFKLEQEQAVCARGGRMLEAEVSGSPPMVAQRKAALYLGGDDALVDACRPVLESITAHQFHIGPFGTAVAMKLIANYLVAIHTLAAAEAVNLGTRAGFDPQLVAEVIKQGAGGSAMFAVRAPLMAARAFMPAPGPFTTLEKYLEMGQDLVEKLGVSAPLFSTAVTYFTRALDAGMGDQDISAVIQLLEAESQTKQEAKQQGE